MMHIDDLLNIIRREAERVVERRASGIRIGTVSSYDPVTHSVKLQLQPDGDQTGWMPVATDGVGNGFGIFCGPTIGQQFAAYFQEGDLEAGIVIGRLANDVDAAVSVQSGETIIKSPTGSLISILQDGSVTIQDKSGATVVLDGSGNVSVLANAGQSILMNSAGAIVMTDKGDATVDLDGSGKITLTGKAKQAITLDLIGNIILNPSLGGRVLFGTQSAATLISLGVL